jgi:serine/threonine-protein kinase
VVLFEILTGRVPFAGRSLSEVLAQHRQHRPPDVRTLAPKLPPGAACLIAAMLAKEPLRRPQTPRELINQLAGLEIVTFAERTIRCRLG